MSKEASEAIICTQAWDFRPGENFVLQMQQVAAEADITLPVLSEAYLKSEYTQPEWAAAFAQDPSGKKRRLIPVRVAECILPSKGSRGATIRAITDRAGVNVAAVNYHFRPIRPARSTNWSNRIFVRFEMNS